MEYISELVVFEAPSNTYTCLSVDLYPPPSPEKLIDAPPKVVLITVGDGKGEAVGSGATEYNSDLLSAI